MDDLLKKYSRGKLTKIPGGLHLPEMKEQSNQTPIERLTLPSEFFVPLVQHRGEAGLLIVKKGEHVLKGQPLTEGEDMYSLPVHAPTSGIIKDIRPFVMTHPSGMAETMVHIEADGEDKWVSQQPSLDFTDLKPEDIIRKLYQYGVAGLGGAVFPTARKLTAGDIRFTFSSINN